ncbi:MAG: YicC family protein [Ruminococcaceae bacterium]|nr:YicC family protein [Oscillospiraceae bacterium]MBQ8898523.1 YicC family protein [Clostridia bacterium]
MVKSMTGYGRSQGVYGNKTLTVELKSVNNRFLDCSVRCPKIYMYLEEPVKAAIKASGVTRGKVDVFIGIEYAAGDVSVSVNEQAAAMYIENITALSDKFELKNDISAMRIATLPDVFTVAKIEEDRDELLAQVLSELNSALEAYNKMRGEEGARLAADIIEKGGAIGAMKDTVQARMPVIVAEYRARLTAKMTEVLGESGVTEQRILAEAAIFADRTATDEETVRLSSHLAQLSEILSAGGAVGRKLDFLVQEINREINTIGSKANDLEVTGLVLEMKCELEKIREQIQNLE